jgi:hypothetical protein
MPRYDSHSLLFPLFFQSSTITDVCQSSGTFLSVYAAVKILFNHFTPISLQALIASFGLSSTPRDLLQGLFVIVVSIS